MAPHSNGAITYGWEDEEHTKIHSTILPVVEVLVAQAKQLGARTLLDLGCGNGAASASFAHAGLNVTGVDPAADGITIAQARFPQCRFICASAYDDLSSTIGSFDIITSLDVIEHLYSPREFVRTLRQMLAPGGVVILSTPYHGYIKNLALALSGRMDQHFTALWDHGHIKFWSRKSLSLLLQEGGFSSIEYKRVGRLPPLAKSLIAICSVRQIEA